MNIDTSNITTAKEHAIIDNMIDIETQRRLRLVPNTKQYQIWTCAVIDGEFRMCSMYDVPNDVSNALEEV